MENNDLNKLKALLEEFKLKPTRKRREANIFSIGSRNYYENPTTDILAFFLDDTEQHGLGSLVLDAIIECLSLKEKLLGGLVSSPLREVCTASQNRIDLILEGDSWVIIIENKIYHEAVNPFSDYEKYAKENYKDKEIHYLILSPAGQGASEEAKEIWKAVSYEKLIEKTRRNLGEYNMANPLNKWSVLLREFILHLEDITMTEKEIDKETIEFVYSNLGSISKLTKLRIDTMRSFNEAVQAKLGISLCKHSIYQNSPVFDCYLIEEKCRDSNSSRVSLYYDYDKDTLVSKIMIKMPTGVLSKEVMIDVENFYFYKCEGGKVNSYIRTFENNEFSIDKVAEVMKLALLKLKELKNKAD